MGDITTVGIDLAKNVFALHGVDGVGRVVLRRTVRRERLAPLVAQLPACLIGMEACTGAHQSARQFAEFGHQVRLMAPKFVAPYRKSGKNDDNDAEAICEAVGRPSMRFVPVKTLEQQAVLTQHRVRQGFIEERTATLNRLRGLLAEFGQVLPQHASEVRRGLAQHLEQLPSRVAAALADLLAHVRVLDERIGAYDRELQQHARTEPNAQRIQQLSGIGPITASAIVASVGSAREFRNGRQFAAWLGADAASALLRGQDPTRPHHAARRSVSAHAPDHGRACGPAIGRSAHRSTVALGPGAEGQARLSPHLCGDRRQERPHPVGAAGARRDPAHRLN